jgi:hypothetical protein
LEGDKMKYLSIIGALAIGFLAPAAHAQNLMRQVAGTWALTSGAEQFADGKKVTPWSAGNLIIDPSGHMSFFIFAKDRPTAGSPDPRKPAGPMVAYYGTVTADDAAKTLTYHVSIWPMTSRLQHIRYLRPNSLIPHFLGVSRAVRGPRAISACAGDGAGSLFPLAGEPSPP